jgi:hypothetical protein
LQVEKVSLYVVRERWEVELREKKRVSRRGRGRGFPRGGSAGEKKLTFTRKLKTKRRRKEKKKEG